MSAQENEALVRRYFEEAWVKRNMAAVDELMVPNYVEHQIPDGRLTSRHSLKQLLAMYYKAFPDMKSVLHDILAQGDRVTYRWSVNATHLGDWLGIPPTGNHMRATGITIYRIVGGKAVEGWSSVAISRSEEEQRWLSEGGTTDEAYPESGDIPLPGLGLERSPAFDALIRNLTWRFRAAEARERERIEQELQVAQRIQRELLPEATPELDGWQIAAYYGPAREVGGDFYDFLELEDGRLGLVVGDATGKGMPAALVMATTRGMLRAVAQSLDSPGEVLARVNDALYPDIPSEMFVTCFYAILDPRSGHLIYANAGHDMPYHRRRNGDAEELRARGMPLGLMPEMSYEEKETILQAGEAALLYSDGLVEAHNPEGEMFGFPRLQALVAEHGEEQSLGEFLLKELSAFTGQEWEQEDDITLLTLRCSAP
jgi:serine phosphatase RsbU (regulator of sigma subunit)/predicted ester cyclase